MRWLVECVRKGYFELDQLRTAVNPFPLHSLSQYSPVHSCIKGSAYPSPTLVGFFEIPYRIRIPAEKRLSTTLVGTLVATLAEKETRVLLK